MLLFSLIQAWDLQSYTRGGAGTQRGAQANPQLIRPSADHPPKDDDRGIEIAHTTLEFALALLGCIRSVQPIESYLVISPDCENDEQV